MGAGHLFEMFVSAYILTRRQKYEYNTLCSGFIKHISRHSFTKVFIHLLVAMNFSFPLEHRSCHLCTEYSCSYSFLLTTVSWPVDHICLQDTQTYCCLPMRLVMCIP